MDRNRITWVLLAVGMPLLCWGHFSNNVQIKRPSPAAGATTTTTLVSDIVHQYMFDEDAATQEDEVGSLDLTVDGATHSTDNGGHYSYDGANDEIKTSSHSSFIDAGSNFSVSVWVQLGQYSVYDCIWAETDSSGRFWMGLPSDSDKIAVARYDGSYTVKEVDFATVPLSSWTHVVFTHSSAGAVGLYVNGSNQTDTTSSPSTSGTTGHNLGARTDEWRPSQWSGKIDDCIIVKDVLTSGEVTSLYQAGAETKSN